MDQLRKQIDRFQDWIGKETLYSLSLILTIILVAFGSFGLGRMSLSDADRGDDPRIEYTVVPSSGTNIVEKGSENAIIASKNSTKYHFVHCPGAKQISDANKITFASVAMAESAGYTKALNCK